MKPLRSEARVIAAAEALAGTLGENPNHAVAAAGDGDLDRMRVGLRGHYPQMPDNALVDVVGFEIRRSR